MKKHIIAAIFAVLILMISVASAADIKLGWDANSEEQLAGYRVFQASASGAYNYTDPAWEGTDLACTISGLPEGDTYYFVVRAFGTNGLESDDSNEVFQFVDFGAPAAPQNLSIIELIIAWIVNFFHNIV